MEILVKSRTADSWRLDSKFYTAKPQTQIDIPLTPNRPLIQLLCARSKLNMDEICSLNIHYTTKSFIEIPPCAKKVIFITEFVVRG